MARRKSYGLDALICQERLDLSAVAKSRRHRAAYDAYATALLLLLRLLDAAPATATSLRHLTELAPFHLPASSAGEVGHAGGQAQQPSLWAPPSQ